MDKLKIYHFNNGSGGGVMSVIRNLIRFSNDPLIENHIIYIINKDETKKYEPGSIEGVSSQQVFFYSPKWNLLNTCKQLAKLVPGEKAILVAHDQLELAMVSNMGLQNRVLQIVHGDYKYYYDLALDHQQSIDVYITVAGPIQKKLQALLPSKKDSIHYIPFPLPASSCEDIEEKGNTIAFVGRCTEAKGYTLLPSIAKLIQEKGIVLSWHIVGKMADDIKEKYPWDKSIDVKFYGEVANEAVNKLLCKIKYFILPSLAEGTPVSLIEAMKAGAISFVNNLPGGIQELVKNGETGFLSENNLPEEYAANIYSLNSNASLQQSIQENCKKLSNDLFNPEKNCKAYETVYIQLSQKQIKIKPVTKVYGSRLDNPLYPNLLVSFIRKIAATIKN